MNIKLEVGDLCVWKNIGFFGLVVKCINKDKKKLCSLFNCFKIYNKQK